MEKERILEKVKKRIIDMESVKQFKGRAGFIKEMETLFNVLGDHKTGPSFHRYISRQADKIYTRFQRAVDFAFQNPNDPKAKNEPLAK